MEVTAIQRKHYTDVALNHMHADNGAMQLVKVPKQFDLIFTDTSTTATVRAI